MTYLPETKVEIGIKLCKVVYKKHPFIYIFYFIDNSCWVFGLRSSYTIFNFYKTNLKTKSTYIKNENYKNLIDILIMIFHESARILPPL